MKLTRCVLLLAVMGSSFVPSRAVEACTSAPPNPPVWITIVDQTPAGTLFKVTFHDYATFGATGGQFCACGLAIGDPSMQIQTVEVIDATTEQPIPGFTFTPDPNVAQSYNNQSGGNWTGFLSNMTQSVPPGISIGLRFCIFVPVQVGFKRGDANCDDVVDGDDIAAWQTVFLGGTGCCVDAADVNDDGQITAVDLSVLLTYLNSGGPIPAPGPTTCGLDPTADALGECLGACQAPQGPAGGAGPSPTDQLIQALQAGQIGTAEGQSDGSIVVDSHLAIIQGANYGAIEVMGPAVPGMSTIAAILVGLILLVAAGFMVVRSRRNESLGSRV